MTAIPAKTDLGSVRRVAILVYPGVTLLDATGPAQVFATANAEAPAGSRPYEVRLCSHRGGEIASDSGVMLGTRSLTAVARGDLDTLLVAGGNGVFEAEEAAVVSWVAEQARRARRSGSTCMGAFLLAAAGLLDGRRAATHWRWCDELQTRYPAVSVERDPIFVRDRGIWTSAGVTAGIDLAIAMVEEDHGRETAMAVARSLVVYLQRPGGQAQFSAALTAQLGDGAGSFADLNAWIAENLHTDLRVERLAERVGMSPRNFARRYAEGAGMTPAKAVERMRVEAAKRLLEDTDGPVSAIAVRTGFGDQERLRRAFLRHLGAAPSAYRSCFRRPAD